MLNNIIADLKSLEGKLVDKGGYFEKIYTNKVDDTTISIIDVLETLEPYELKYFESYNFIDDIYEKVEFEDFIEVMEYEEVKSNNSYNWLSPISNHFDYRIYKSGLYDRIIVEFKVHRFGDVRCNYTEEAYFEFDNEYEFYDALIECNKYFTIEKNDKTYEVEIDIFVENPNIYIEEDNENIEGYEAYELLEKLLED